MELTDSKAWQDGEPCWHRSQQILVKRQGSLYSKKMVETLFIIKLQLQF